MIKTDVMYRLEYSENQGNFHYAEVETQKQLHESWGIICNKISLQQCWEFTELMDKKYPVQRINNKDCYVSLDTVKKEFENFLLS